MDFRIEILKLPVARASFKLPAPAVSFPEEPIEYISIRLVCDARWR